MTKALPSREDHGSEEMENIRIGYQVAVNLWWYLGDLVWAEYNAMLVVNGIVAAAIGIGLTSQQPSPILTVGLSVVGLIFCALWFLLVKRGVAHYLPYIYAARELEDEYLGSQVRVISRGNEYAQGKKVTYQIDGKPESIQMKGVERHIPTTTTSYLVIVIFAVIYVIMLIQGLQ